MVRGKLIVLEGIDGSGKTTQTKMLVARLKREGYAVETIDFPQYYTTFFGKMVAQYLRGEFGALDQVSPYLAAILYAGDRFERKEQLEQWLAEGKIVIANRYVSANMGHQASKIPRSKRAVFVQWLDQLEYGV
ncbi:MAG TPA: thymidylate kinase, partial [Candidatus Nanoarchaeia archaeon]|nr:thymidylate kinase [Candidatus Nanoarchaeia archaeon]